MPQHRRLTALIALAAVALLAGCGSGGGTTGLTVLPARTSLHQDRQEGQSEEEDRLTYPRPLQNIFRCVKGSVGPHGEFGGGWLRQSAAFDCFGEFRTNGGRFARPPSAYSTICVTTPAPTVRLPSRIAKRACSSSAIGLLSSIVSSALSPGITISAPSPSWTVPVTSAVRK